MTAETEPGRLGRLRRSPLEHRRADLAAASRRDVALVELPFLSMVGLRVEPGSAAAARVEAGLGLGLPGPGAVASVHTGEGALITGAIRSVLWLGPDEWLVVGPDGDIAELVRLLDDAIGEGPGSVVDVSANRDTLVLSGPRARAVLEKGITLDLHPRSFSAGRCAQTTLAKGHVLLWQTADEGMPGGPVYRLLFRGSFADYMADWLTDAAAEFG